MTRVDTWYNRPKILTHTLCNSLLLKRASHSKYLVHRASISDYKSDKSPAIWIYDGASLPHALLSWTQKDDHLSDKLTLLWCRANTLGIPFSNHFFNILFFWEINFFKHSWVLRNVWFIRRRQWLSLVVTLLTTLSAKTCLVYIDSLWWTKCVFFW